MTPSFLISPDKSTIIVAEKNLPQISIFDSRGFRKMKSITFHIDSMRLHDILFMSVSNDSKWIVMIMGEPVLQCVYASMEKGKVLACEKVECVDLDLCGVQLNPFDSSSFAVVDKNGLFFKKYDYGVFISQTLQASVQKMITSLIIIRE